MTGRIYLNNSWYYAPEPNSEIFEVRIPHTNIELPMQYFDEKDYQFVSCYSKGIFAEKDWEGKIILLTFEGVGHVARVFVGNQFVGEHYGGYTAFTLDISQYLNYDDENNILVEVDSRETNNLPPFGNVVDYLTYGGIYRDVYLEIKEPIYIKDVFVSTPLVELDEKDIELEVEINEVTKENLKLRAMYRKCGEEEWKRVSSVDVQEVKSSFRGIGYDVELWEVDNPALYEMKVELLEGSEVIDEKIERFGFRTCEFREDGFYLNDRYLKIRGLNRHQSYPYVGYAMPKRPQQLDAEMIKNELGLNAVRTSHYPQSQHFIDRCDELGILVFTELPGWQHIGDEKWQGIAIQNIEEMVKQYRNHPSIILWGARINESQDSEEFYTLTNRKIRGMDKSRARGGVRFLKKSQLLEDVYTYNDFSHTGDNPGLEKKWKVTSDKCAPYLISEYNGHMFPTKAFDNEEHRLEHALRHANVLQAIYADPEVTGGFGWCMFDYHTHKDFGSGDKICYHGVMNMFRIPKLAASVYASQGEQEPVLEISSSMDIGDHPGGELGTVYAFTNCDSIKLYKNDQYVKTFYPDKKKYSALPHPPIVIDDFIGELIETNEKYSSANAKIVKKVLQAVRKYGHGNLPIHYKLMMAKVMAFEKLSKKDGMNLFMKYVGNWGAQATTYRFEGMKNDEVVKVVQKSSVNKAFLQVTVDTTHLQEGDTYDVSTIRIKVTDRYGNVLPYYQGAIGLQTEGKIQLIGPSVVCPIGGSIGTYVKSVGYTGHGALTITGIDLEPVRIEYRITNEQKDIEE